MADEQRKHPRSIDERLDAITMNLELQIRETETLRQMMKEGFDELRESMTASWESDRVSMAASWESDADFRAWVTDFRASVTEFRETIQPAVVAQLKTVDNHETRIECLERRAS